MRPHRVRAAVLVAAVLLAATGCGGGNSRPALPIKGEVFQGKTACKGAWVVFHPTDPSLQLNANPWGVVSENGSFQLSTYRDRDGAPAGEYRVTIIWEEKKHVLGEERSLGDRLKGRYADKDRSGLKAEIKERDQTIRFDLK
jgi:hypothetical protein